VRAKEESLEGKNGCCTISIQDYLLYKNEYRFFKLVEITIRDDFFLNKIREHNRPCLGMGEDVEKRCGRVNL
jgi:hypothetical protein